ncbi:MAG: ATP-binding protein [Candidatus Brocadiales bacterium]
MRIETQMCNKELKGLSIKSKLLLFSLCISLIPIAIITTIYFFTARNTLKKQTLAWMTAVAESRKAHLIAYLEAEKGRTVDFASDGFIRDSLEAIVHKEAFSEGVVVSLNNHLMRNKKLLDSRIVTITVANMDGKVIASTSEILIGKDISGLEVFLQAVSKGPLGASIGQPVHIPYLHADCIPFATLITSREGGDAIGILINIYYNFDILSEITTIRAGMGETGEVYLVNRDGVMLTKSMFIEGTPLKQVVDTEPIRKIAMEGKEMTGIYPNYRGVPVVGASAYIPEYGWTLLAEIDKAEAFAPIRTLGFIAMMVGALSAATVIGVGIIFTFSATMPIKNLIVATNKFKEGDLKYRARITSKDETGLLAYSFNDMAARLNEDIIRRKRVEVELEKERRNLENTVKVRTKELRKSLKKITDTNFLLEQANRAKSQFLSSMSHELRTPLNAILGFADLLRGQFFGKLNEKQLNYADQIDVSGKHLLSLINDLLDVSKIDAGGMKLKLDAISPEEFINATVSMMSSQFGKKKILLKTSVKQSLPVVTADIRKCKQILMNLLSNAVKFTPEGGQVEIRALKNGDPQVRIEVSDTGIGIAADKLDKIFSEFYQADHVRDEQLGGTGIGLALTHRLVELQGGKIGVESKLGEGSTFWFTLPLKKVVST